MKLERNKHNFKEKVFSGQITVYLALMLVLVLSLVCTTVEGVRLEGSKLMIQNIMQMGLESIFAEYNKELLEEYDLFFVDTGYGQKNPYVVDNRMYDYVKKNYDLGIGIATIDAASVYRIYCEDIVIDKKVLATDDKGMAYFVQVVDYMEDKVGIDGIKSFYDTYCKDTNQKIQDYENVQKEKDNKLSGLSDAKIQYEEEYKQKQEATEENGEDTDMEPPSKESNPLDSIGQYMSMGILELILGNDISISGKQIELGNLPSHRELNSGDGIYKKDNSITSKLVFVEYLKDKFKNVTDYEEVPEEETALDYQLEYIYAGRKSDSKNLEEVLSKLLLMREGINMSYLLTDTSKMAQAQALAAALVGYLGVPAFVEGMKYALLAGWAFAESVVEIRGLVNGKKIAVVKNSSNWNVEFSELADFSNLEVKEEASGIDYTGCLTMLFYMGNTQKYTMRSLDVIEMEIQRKSGNSNFFVDNCLMKCRACGNWEIDNVFLNLGYRMLSKGDTYALSTSVEYSYIEGY